MNPLPLVLIFIIGEALAVPIFALMRGALGPSTKDDAEGDQDHNQSPATHAAAKGIVERLFLYVSLLAGIPHALTAFGALKIATRINEDSANKISNDYFLIGNLTSIGLAITYYWIAREIGAFYPE